MGWIIDLSERSGDVRRFEDGLMKAKHGIKEAYEIWEDMKNQFSERRGYDERYNQHGDYPRMSERDWQELQERRRHDRW